MIVQQGGVALRTDSRTKGKRGERELVRVLIEADFDARRGVQYAGGPDSPDVVCSSLPGVHWEVKRSERLSLYGSIDQAVAQAGNGQVPVVAHRRNRREWLAVLRLADLLAILRGWGYATPGGRSAVVGRASACRTRAREESDDGIPVDELAP